MLGALSVWKELKDSGLPTTSGPGELLDSGLIHPSVSAGDLLPGEQHKIREFKIKFCVCVLGGEGQTVPHFYLCVNTTVPPQSPHHAD